MAHSFQVTFDSADPATHAAFWAEALGYVDRPPPPGFDSWEDVARHLELTDDDMGGFATIMDPAEEGPRILFLRVPEPKTAKNRMHLDINISDPTTEPQERRELVDVEVERLVALGATKVASFDEAKGVWTVMLDPEGNEFCVH